MKLVVAGASGFVATEVIRQSLRNPKITSVMALARRSVLLPSNLGKGADSSKLQSVVIDDYGNYPDEVKRQLAGVDACIWTVAITPRKSRGLDFEEVRRVCQDNTLAGLQVLFNAHSKGSGHGAQPFRFVYMSGAATERDQNKTPSLMPEYSLMRGETENRVLAFAADHKGGVEVCVVRPGLITATGQYLSTIRAALLKLVMSLPNVDVAEISAAMLHEAIHGFEKDTLENADLVTKGRQAFKVLN